MKTFSLQSMAGRPGILSDSAGLSGLFISPHHQFLYSVRCIFFHFSFIHSLIFIIIDIPILIQNGCNHAQKIWCMTNLVGYIEYIMSIQVRTALKLKFTKVI